MDERHYNVKKLNTIFAIASLILLGSLGMMFMKDYDRTWKDYQKEFRAREVEKARVKYDMEMNNLKDNSDYLAAQEALEKAQEEFEVACTDFHEIESEIVSIKAENDILQQQYKFSKAEYDVVKYEYESAANHHGAGDVDTLKAKVDAIYQRTNELKLKVEDSTKVLEARTSVIESCGDQLKKVQKEYREVAKQKQLIERKLDKIDPKSMSVANQLANVVRDLPVIDLANPNNKIQQIVLKDIRDDVNFMTVPKVDRCVTCHLGITNPDYENAKQPFKTHPNLELYLGKDSAHPVEEFGCTVCHSGRGRGTEFSGAAHTPRNEAQKKEWEKKYNYKKIELWEEPMYPLQFTQAGCFKCHSGEGTVKGADKLNLGLQVIEQAGCYACHEIDRYEGWDKPGPDLTQLASKISKDWAFKWIEDPRSFRHNTWMPSYYNQANNSDPESKKRGLQEIHSMVHYLFEKNIEYPLEKIPVKGDAEKGKELVKSVGCYACHQVKPEKDSMPSTADSLRQEFGPNLIGLGSKTSKEWLYDWLKDPKKYHSGTAMPNLRLSDQEAADIAEYLHANKAIEFESNTVPPVDVGEVDKITLGFLSKANPIKVAEEKLSQMSLDDKLMFSGEKLIGQYGCYSCHNIEGFDGAKPIGIELTEEGSKNIHNLDFGFVHIDHTKHAWFAKKLEDPRIFDKGKIKRPDEKLMMPNFYLSKDEIDAAVTAILGFVKTNSVETKMMPRTPEQLAIEEGQMLVKQMNCQGCHTIEGEGMTIQESVKEWLVEYDNRTKNEAETVAESFSPPNLYGVGAKLDPEWLFNFLHKPEQEIRPWLRVKMPTYEFNAEHLNILLKYFHTIDEERFPFDITENTKLTKEEFVQAEKLFSDDYFGCTLCHVVGDQLPSGAQDSWAPNLGLARTRLQPEWIFEWIKNPPALMPGTKMPAFYDPDNYDTSGPDDIMDGDEDEQIRILRNYLLTLSESGNSKTKVNSKPDVEVKVEIAPTDASDTEAPAPAQ